MSSNPQAGPDSPQLSIGVDLGGTSIRIGAYDEGWNLLDGLSLPTRVADGPEAVVADIAAGVQRVISNLDRQTPATLGIGSPGPLNLRDGTLGRLPNFPGWDDFPLRGALEAAVGMEIYLDSDANAAALAEWKAGSGAAVGIQSMCMLTLGTGVGSGIILDGKIWHGMIGRGGEAGHIPLSPYGPACGCGAQGCLEVFASATALCRMAREAANAATTDFGPESLGALIARDPNFTARDVALLAAQGEKSARIAFERLGFYLGYALAGLINTLDLPLYSIGGGLVSAWDLFAPSMFSTVRDYSYVYRLSEPSQFDECEADKTCILPASLGAGAGLLGAAMLPSLGPWNAS